MEESLIVIFQVFFELALQVLAEWPWDALVGQRATPAPRSGTGIWIVLSFVMGSAVGAGSLLVFPATLIHLSSARIANLIVAPMVTGVIAFYSRPSAKREGDWTDPRMRAACAACFTLMIALIRFTYASRGK